MHSYKGQKLLVATMNNSSIIIYNQHTSSLSTAINLVLQQFFQSSYQTLTIIIIYNAKFVGPSF